MFDKHIPVCHTQGEELRKLIGATYYIECSSKTQQVTFTLNHIHCRQPFSSDWQLKVYILQNVKAVFDSAIKEVIKPVVKQKAKTQKTKKQKSNHGCLSWVYI